MVDVYKGSLSCYAVQSSNDCSSTGAELMGLVYVAHTNRTVHVAIDTKSVVDFAIKIRERCSANDICYPGIPLFMRTNCDVWAAFYAAVRARGPHSIRVSETTGQVCFVLKDFVEFSELLADAEHNEEADELTRKARVHLLSLNV